MKKKSPGKIIFSLFILLATALSAQNVGINTSGALPSINAILDLNTGNANNLGLIIPNVSLTALNTFNPPIANAATAGDKGMMVYNTNALVGNGVGYYYWNGATWVSVSGGATTVTACGGAVTNNIPVYTSATTICNSIINQNVAGTMIGIGLPAVNTEQEGLSIYNGLNIDQANTDNGSLAGNPNQALTFGSFSGEGIGSQRTGGAKQWGLDFYTNFTERMTILNNGFTGVNITTPAAPLEVSYTGDVPFLQINTTSGANKRTRINFSQNQAVGMEIGTDYFVNNTTDLYIYNRATGQTGAYFNPGNNIWLSARSVNSDFYINNIGRIGMGTIGPANQLVVTGNASFGGNTANTGCEPMEVQGGCAGYSLYDRNGGANERWVMYSAEVAGAGTNELRFWQNGIGDRMVINAAGNVGIGTNVPAYPLTVQATVINSCNNYEYINQATVGHVGGNSGNVPISIYSQGRIICAAEIDVTSDKRLKDTIDNISTASALSAIVKLKPVHFSWKKEVSQDQSVIAGFYAQEVYSIIPEAVTIMPGMHFQDEHILNYDMLTTYSIAAIQEQQKLIVNQQKVAEAQQATIDELKKEIELLKQQIAGLSISNASQTASAKTVNKK